MRIRPWTFVFGASFACAAPALAGGFYIQEQNAAGVGRAQAGDVAAADDASTIYFNPAGMTELHGVTLTLGTNVIIPSASLTDRGSTNRSFGSFLTNFATNGVVPANGSNGGNPGSAQAVPSFYIAAPIAGTDFAVGLGLSAPFGFVSQFKPDSFARYDSIESLLQTVDIAPSIAWKVNDWVSIGAGLDEQYAHVKLDTALPAPLLLGGPTPASDGRLTLRAHNWATGFNVGILIKPTPGTKIGVSYRSGITHNFNGRVQFQGLSGPLQLNARNGIVGGAAALDLPDIVTAGFSQAITPRFTLMGEVDYYQWSNFKEINIRLADGTGNLVTPENYRNTWSAAVGGEYQLTDAVKLRAGLKWDETPTVNAFRDTRVPDGNRIWVAGGLGWKFSDHMSFDASYAHIFVKDSSVNLTRPFYAGAPLPVTTVSTIAATSHVKIDILSIGVNYVF